MALSENQLTSQGTAIKTLQGDSGRIDQLQKQIDDLQGQNTALKSDGSKVLSAYQTENEQLRSQVSALSTQVQRATAGPNALYGPGAPATYQRAGTPPASNGRGRRSGRQRERLRLHSSALQRSQTAGIQWRCQRHRHADRAGQDHAVYRQRELPAAQFDRNRARSGRGRCDDEHQEPDRSAARRAADHRPGAVGLCPGQAAQDQPCRLHGQWRGNGRPVVRESLRQITAHDLPATGRACCDQRCQRFHCLWRQDRCARTGGQPLGQSHRPGAS